jgi:nucleotide-binding universal stress UspA family protein
MSFSMFDSMLVPLDGSEAAEAALAVAELIPSRRVRLLSVESDLSDLTAICLAEPDCQTYLERVAEPLRRQGRKVETVVAFGDPARKIVASAATADLVVMGSHGRGAAGRLVPGSIAEQVARGAPVPTLIVRGGQKPVAPIPITRIVVPLDGSPLAEQALPMAVALAGSLGLPVHLVRVVEVDPVRGAGVARSSVATAHTRPHAETGPQAEEYLVEQVQALRNMDVAATSELRTGAPASELLDAIRNGDLTVLTTRDRGGIERWMLGSVAEELVRRAAGPVLLVRAIHRVTAGQGVGTMASVRSTAKVAVETPGRPS